MVQLGIPILRLNLSGCLVTGVVATLIAGCALKTPPTRDEIITEALPTGTEIAPTWQAGGVEGPLANNWLDSFADPALSAIVAEALANNLDLRQAAQRVAIAQQYVVVAGSELLPRIGASAGARSTRDLDENVSTNTNVLQAVVGWELDIWGRLRAQRAASEAGYEATALDYAYARQSLAATVAKAWYLASAARQLLSLSEQGVAIYQQQLELVQYRRTSGKDSELDLVDTRARLDSAKAAVEAARQTYGEAQRALEVILGRYPAAEIEAATSFPPLSSPPATGLPAALLTRRPDVIAAQRMVLATFRQTEAAELARLPSLSTSLTIGRLGDQLPSLLDINPWLGSAAIGVSVPIYEGGSLRAQIRIANARQSAAVAQYGSVILNAFRESENSIANEELTAKRLPLIESSVRNQTEAVEIATTQYKTGRRDLLWVSSLQAERLLSEADLIRLQGYQRINRIQLYLALGGSFDQVDAASTAGIDLSSPGGS